MRQQRPMADTKPIENHDKLLFPLDFQTITPPHLAKDKLMVKLQLD